MTMLTLVQNFCRRTNLAVPTTVFGSTDTQVLQIMALLEEEGNDLSGRGDWEGLTNEATHTTVATESQGAITTIASNNFRYIKNGTFWDRTLILPVGVIGNADWQSAQALTLTGPRYHVRLRGGNLLSNPVPTAGNTWAFEYISYNWILDNDGTTGKQYFTEDTDTFLVPEAILMVGLRWRWKKEKGLDYEEDFKTYEGLVADALSRNGLSPVLQMDNRSKGQVPGICTPQGNWLQ